MTETGIGVWLRALRWKQWVKNVLIFLPLLFSHHWMQPGLITRALIAFAIYCVGASAVYLLNDVMDEAVDREHPEKRFRPLAAGLISRSACWIISGALLALSIGAAVLLLSREFLAVYLLYVIAATAYSSGLKKVVMLDALMLAGFYTLRIFAGSVATGVPVSNWLLLFSMFFFLALAACRTWISALGRARQFSRFCSARSMFLPLKSILLAPFEHCC